MAAGSQLAETSSRVEVRFGTTQPQRRWTVLLRFILGIPQFIVLGFVGIGAFVVVVLGWFAALFTGRLPASFARFLLGYLRWTVRVYAYAFLLTDVYPPFALDPDPNFPVDLTVTTGRLNRAAVLFRIILVIPANIVATVLTYGMILFSFISWIVTLILGRMPDAFFGASAAAIRWQARTSGYFTMLTSYYPSDILGDKDTLGRRLDATTSGTQVVPPPAPDASWGQHPLSAPPTYSWGTAEPSVGVPLPPPPPFVPPGAPTTAPPVGPPPLAPPPPPAGTVPSVAPDVPATPNAGSGPASGPAPGDTPVAPASDVAGLTTPDPGASAVVPPPLPPHPPTFGAGPPLAPGAVPAVDPATVPSVPPAPAPPLPAEGAPTPPRPGAIPPYPAPEGPVPSGTAGTPDYPAGPGVAPVATSPAPFGAPPPPPSGMLPPPPPFGAPPPPPLSPGPMPPPPPPGAYGTPAAALWPLGLSSGARVLTVIFIVLGVAGYAAQSAFNVSHPFQNVFARIEVQAAYSSVGSDTQAFRTAAQACARQGGDTELQCLNSAAGTWASGLQDYSTALSNVTYPASVQGQASAAESAAQQAATAVNALASSPDVPTFVATDNSSQFQETLDAADTTYRALYSALGG